MCSHVSKAQVLHRNNLQKNCLEKEHVAVVPGNAFGDCGEGFLRVSYSYSLNHITEALSRIQRFLKERGSN